MEVVEMIFLFNWEFVGHFQSKPVDISYYLETKLLLISIHFTKKPAIVALKKWYK